MAVSIVSARFGDERSDTDVTDSLTKKITGGKLAVPVNSSLIPIVQVGGRATLTSTDQQEIQEKAEKACGGNDTGCVEMKKQEFARQALEKKKDQLASTANVVKGRKLTVTMKVDGKQKVFVIPEGQEFKLTEKELGKRKLVDAEGKSGKSWFTMGDATAQALKAGTIILLTFGYVFTVVATYRVFAKAGYEYLTYAATAVAAFIPYSGIWITLVFFGLKELVANMPVPKTVA